MKLTKEQLETYHQEGMLLIPDCFLEKEVKRMHDAISELIEEDTPGRVLEQDKKTIRALHGCNMTSKLFHHLTLHPRLLEPAQQILQSEVYLYQFKINFKTAFNGDLWPWHQDFVFWDKEDGMPSPRAINVAIFLDEVNEFNGPLYCIPGSHKVSHEHIQAPSRSSQASAEKTEWLDSFVANLKYSLDRETIAKLVDTQGIVAPKGGPGAVLFFHCNLVHGSVSNISPYDRRLAIITYNSLENIPVSQGEPRPQFLVNQNHTPLQPVADEILL